MKWWHSVTRRRVSVVDLRPMARALADDLEQAATLGRPPSRAVVAGMRELASSLPSSTSLPPAGSEVLLLAEEAEVAADRLGWALADAQRRSEPVGRGLLEESWSVSELVGRLVDALRVQGR